MASELTPTYDSDTCQVVLEGLPTGPAGGAGLVPVPGLELVFDRADGRLSQVVVDTGQPDSPFIFGEAVADALIGLFGQQAPAAIRDAAAQRGVQPALSLDMRLSATWSRLARLESARGTSPIPASPLWAAEAAQLTEQAGFHRRARAEARQAAAGLTEMLSHAPVPEVLSQAARAVADIIELDEPDAAGQLRGCAEKPPARSLEQWLAGQPAPPMPLDAAPGQNPGNDNEQIPGLQWSLDPGILPKELLLPGLSPLSDIIVHPGDGQDRVIVEALLAAGADRGALSRCRVRLVDPSARRVLASAPFVQERSRVRAELMPPFPIDELKQTWVEVVDDELRPVRSEQLRRTRRALRWADAALRAEQRPQGLAPHFTGQDWKVLAAMAWERCSYDWEDSGDTDRASLATRRLAALNPATRVPEPPSKWTADLADRPRLQEPAFLAEAIGR